MWTLRLMVLGTVALGFSGCTSYVTAVKSVQGKAYIAKSDGTLWNCDATGAEPVCYEAIEMPTVQPAEKK